MLCVSSGFQTLENDNTNTRKRSSVFEILLLILLDLSTAFDTINHSLMMDILENDFGVVGVVKRWFRSYLDERQQRVKIKQHMSDCFQLNSGVPQGSCLGPVLFLMYASLIRTI